MEVKKIGAYLFESKTCDRQLIDEVLKRQLALEQEGIYKPIGQLIIEIGGLKSETLDLILRRQGEDLLREAELFKSFSPELISRIAGVAAYIAFPKGQVIIHTGDQGDSFSRSFQV